jgi:sphinganine-1-phosphate aldolase
MGLKDRFASQISRLAPKLVGAVEKPLKAIPFVNRRLEQEYAGIMADLEHSLKPYRGEFPTYARLPENGRARPDLLQEIAALTSREEARWKEGYVSGAVFFGDDEHVDFLNQVYNLNAPSNALHAHVWPSVSKFEAEVVAMTADMLGGSQTPDEICGTLTSGGTESILMAMKTYRDWARETKGITQPEVIAPITAHAAFDKAAHYFGLKLVRIPVDDQFRADWIAAKNAISKNTIAMVGSAPSYPHGMVDPISEMAALAREAGVGFHVDACVGGFVLPWAEKLGYRVPPFDFRLPGVTSMSADTHKYGLANKGSSVVLYRTPELRRYQYFVVTDWPGGIYFSPGMAGSRPGAAAAATWAAMVATGQDGYLEMARRVLETAQFIRREVVAIPGLRVLGDPLFIIAFAADEFDIYRVMDRMSKKGWSLNGLHRPACIHIMVTPLHTQPGVQERLIADLREAVAFVQANPDAEAGLAPVYGMAASLPARGVVGDLLKRYMDVLYRV